MIDRDVPTFDELMIKYFKHSFPEYQEDHVKELVSYYLLNGVSLEKCFRVASDLRIERDDLYFDHIEGAFADALSELDI
jgi:hypothetical protein